MLVGIACQNDRPAQQTGKLQELGRQAQGSERMLARVPITPTFSRYTRYESQSR
jgi:hypothetical protein